MNLRRSWVLCAVALGIGLTAVIGVRAGEALKARPTSTAVADVEKIFDSLREKGEIESSLHREQDKLSADNDAKKQKISDDKSALDILNPNSPDYKKKEDDLEQETLTYQAWAQWQQEKFEQDQALEFLGLYKKIEAAVAEVAKNSGYDLVLYKETPPTIPTAKPEELMALIRAMIRSRKVLYASDDLDITDQVTQVMNNEYANRVGAAATAPQPTPGNPGSPGSK